MSTHSIPRTSRKLRKNNVPVLPGISNHQTEDCRSQDRVGPVPTQRAAAAHHNATSLGGPLDQRQLDDLWDQYEASLAAYYKQKAHVDNHNALLVSYKTDPRDKADAKAVQDHNGPSPRTKQLQYLDQGAHRKATRQATVPLEIDDVRLLPEPILPTRPNVPRILSPGTMQTTAKKQGGLRLLNKVFTKGRQLSAANFVDSYAPVSSHSHTPGDPTLPPPHQIPYSAFSHRSRVHSGPTSPRSPRDQVQTTPGASCSGGHQGYFTSKLFSRSQPHLRASVSPAAPPEMPQERSHNSANDNCQETALGSNGFNM